MLMCTVCGEWYPMHGRDVLDICEGCLPNFAGAEPPLAWLAPPGGETVTLTPRQVQALARMHLRWQAREEES